MLSKWPIRNKLFLGVVLLLAIVATLSATGFLGVYRYRSLVRSLERRSAELPLTTSLGLQVSELRTISEAIPNSVQVSTVPRYTESDGDSEYPEHVLMWQRFCIGLKSLRDLLGKYQRHLDRNDLGLTQIDDSQRERETVASILVSLDRIDSLNRAKDWMLNELKTEAIRKELKVLQKNVAVLPSHLHQRLGDLRNEVKVQYRTLIGLSWIASASAILLLFVLIRLFYAWMVHPLREIISGSRKVAAGCFDHEIRIESRDEMGELAGAMNDMTKRFRTIRDDLDMKVKQRTRQVLRSEQLASVGFLAAGVAHEINNPLASIAMCAESLQSRVDDVLETDNEQHDVIRTYLRMIQDEAFRCKEITEKLLDFSRIGEFKRHNDDLRELVRGVISMVRHLGKYRDKHIDLIAGDPVVLPIDSQQMKQVVLNLITNSLDSLESGGRVRVTLSKAEKNAVLIVQDDGCGMTAETLEHLYEPFFSRRRIGQGTGLGLSITYRIISDHDGNIKATSDGPDQGAEFCITLPLNPDMKERDHRNQAA